MNLKSLLKKITNSAIFNNFKKAKKRLFKSKKQEANIYQTIINNIPDYIYFKDTKSRFLVANKALMNALNVEKPEDIIGKTDFDIISKNQYTELYLKEEEEVFKTGKPLKNRRRQAQITPKKNNQGQRRWVSTSKTPVRDDDGNIYGLVGITKDITHLKHTEKELEESRARYKAILEDQTELICRFLPDTTLTFANEAYCQYFNKTQEELIGKKFLELMPKNTRKDATKHLKSISPDNPVAEMTHKATKDDGSIKWQQWVDRGFFDKNGKTVEYQSVGRDITKSKQLEETWKKYASIVNNSKEFMTLINRDLVYEAVNEPFCEAHGLKREEIIGKSVEEIWGKKKFNNILKNQFERAFKGEEIKFKSRFKFKKTDVRFYEVSYHPYKDSNGEISNIIVVTRDITKQAETERALIKAKKTAEREKKAKDDFLANMSHEIRTPLNGIVGLLTLLSNTKLNKQQKEYIEAMNLASDNLLVIINDILNLSKIEAGKIVILNEEFSLEKMIHNLCKTIKYKGEAKELEMSCHIDPEIPKALIGDPIRLQQILLNLLDNAIKFTKKGSIQLKINLHKKRPAIKKYTLEFKVIDTGVGIDKKDLKNIFNIFEQSTHRLNKEYQGTGLGLSIVKRLIEMQNGEIEVESEIGKGTKFTFYLDFKKGKRESIIQKEASPTPEKYHFPNTRVLIVEDNKLNQIITKKVLNNAGIKAEIADNGEIALEKTLNQEFDLVLMDLHMPHMDGIETAKLIRKNSKRRIPIILMSADVYGERIVTKKGEKMHDYIIKPFKPSELYKKIQALVKIK